MQRCAILSAVILSILNAIWCPSALAQERDLVPSGNFGLISGHVMDGPGCPVAGAAITITREGLSEPIKTITDAQGNYSVIVPSGKGYKLLLVAKGYNSVIKGVFAISAGEKRNIRIDLEGCVHGKLGT